MRVLLLSLLAAALFAQAKDPVASLIEEARSQPVEIFTDLSFRLLPRVLAAQRIAILKEIFERAGEARAAFPTNYPWLRAVDTLSLRSRAVREMLPLDAEQGRRLFEAMAHPEVPQATCEDAKAPTGAIYIETVESVFKQGNFTGEERRKGVPWSMIVSAIRQARSSGEIAAAAVRFPGLAATEGELSQLTSALVSALALQDSDRGFSGLPPSRLVKAIRELGKKHPAAELPLLLALRAYLVRHLTAERCEDSVQTASDGTAAFAEAISGRTDVLPLSASEIKPAKRQGKPRPAPVYPVYSSLAERVRELGKRPQSGERNARALQALADVEAWSPSGWDSADIARHKLRLFFEVSDGGPANVQRIAMDYVIQVLADPLFLRQAPALWLLELGELLLAGGSPPQPDFVADDVQMRLRQIQRFLAAKVSSGDKIAELLAASRSAALSLYGRLLLLNR